MKTIFSILLLAATLFVNAQKGDVYLHEFKNSKGNAYRYWGQAKNGVPEGKGLALLYISNKYAFYTGDFKNGLREGKGTMHWVSGYHYEGNWVGDTIGAGTAEYFINSTGGYYEGGMQGLKFNGQGIFYFGDGRVVTGEFKNSLQNGYCIYQERNGGRYEGFFKDGKYEGDGIYTDSAGIKKEGQWKAGVLETPGKVTLSAKAPTYKLPKDTYIRGYRNSRANIFSYRGPVKNQVPDGNGMGIYYYGNNQYALYKGSYKNGDRHGKGEMYFHNGELFTGEWVNDSLKNGTYYFSNGNRYVGTFAGNNREGKGEFYFFDGNVYKGEFKKSKYNGKGVYTGKDFSYTGDFVDDKYHGKGKMVQGAVVKDGDWENNLFKGKEQYVLPKGIKEFAGADTWMKDKVKEDILALFRSYNNSKLASVKGGAIRKNERGQQLFDVRTKLTGADTLYIIKDTTVIYGGSMGATGSRTDAEEALRKMDSWLASFLNRNYTSSNYTYTIEAGYAHKSNVFTDKEQKATLCLYIQFKGGLYFVKWALAKKEGYSSYDDDEDDWWF